MSNSLFKRFKLFTTTISNGGGAAAAWGAITGTLSDQTDLQSALDGKLDDTATTADVDPSTDRNYVTDAELDLIQDTSGTNTGDETKTSIVTKLEGIGEYDYWKGLLNDFNAMREKNINSFDSYCAYIIMKAYLAKKFN